MGKDRPGASSAHQKILRQRPIRLLLAVGLLGVSPCATAWAAPSLLNNVFQRLEGKLDVKWSTPQVQQVYGLDLSTSQFTSDANLSESARHFAQTGMFSGMLLASQKIQLSGITADQHWLAQLQASRSGTQGYVSVLQALPDAASRQPSIIKKLNFPADTTSVWLEHVFQFGDRQVSQNVMHINMENARLLAYLQRKLRGEGWKQDLPLSLSAGWSSWSKQEEKLTLLPDAAGDGNVVYHSYFQPSQKEQQ